MKEKDFFKLRLKINVVFKKWFSYSRRHNCLYCDWLPTEREHRELINFLGCDFGVMVVLPNSTFIFFIKK